MPAHDEARLAALIKAHNTWSGRVARLQRTAADLEGDAAPLRAELARLEAEVARLQGALSQANTELQGLRHSLKISRRQRAQFQAAAAEWEQRARDRGPS